MAIQVLCVEGLQNKMNKIFGNFPLTTMDLMCLLMADQDEF